MLDSYTLLLAMNGIDEKDVLAAALALKCYKTSNMRRIIKIGLIAAIIVCLLCCTAYAISLSVHAKRQEQLRQEYKVEENNITAYEEFELTEQAEQGIALLSAYNDGNIQSVYVNVSPVLPEEVIDPFMQTVEAGGQVHYLTYIASVGEDKSLARFYVQDNTYAPEDYIKLTDEFGNTWEDIKPEAKKAKYLAQSYDAETQTLTLEFSFWVKHLPEGATQAEVKIYSVDNWAYPDERGGLAIDMKQQIHRDFGSIMLDVVPPDTRKIDFGEVPEFENPYDGHRAKFLGCELSSGQITWLMELDDEVLSYLDNIDEFGERGSDSWRKAFDRQLSWLRFEDDILRDAAIILRNGERVSIPGSTGYSIENGIRRIYGCSWDSTIAIADVEAVYFAGEIYTLPALEFTPMEG